MMQLELRAIESFIDNLYRTKPEWSENRKLEFFANYIIEKKLHEGLLFYGLLYFPEAYDKFVTQAESKALLIKQDAHQLN
jgi:hypothetical protein